MKGLTTAVASILFFACPVFAGEHSVLARVTVYWHREGSGEHAAWNGAQLHERHCAVDPKKVPYGSKVVFPDATCVAADSGPDVVNRKPRARAGGLRLSAAPSSSIVFSIRSKRRAPGQKPIHIS